MSPFKRIFAALPIAITLALVTGCASWSLPNFGPNGTSGSRSYLPSDPSMMLDRSVNEETYKATQQAQSSGRIVLHVPEDSDPVRVLPLPTDGNTVRVSDLLRQSGLSSKLSNVNVTLFRAMGPTPSGLRLNVRMEGKRVRPETDYALQPGDRIHVRSEPNSDIIQSLLEMSN